MACRKGAGRWPAGGQPLAVRLPAGCRPLAGSLPAGRCGCRPVPADAGRLPAGSRETKIVYYGVLWYACMHVMHACIYACTHALMFACMDVCMDVGMHACMHVCICMYTQIKNTLPNCELSKRMPSLQFCFKLRVFRIELWIVPREERHHKYSLQADVPQHLAKSEGTESAVKGLSHISYIPHLLKQQQVQLRPPVDRKAGVKNK